MTELRDEVVFITGASSGIGAACARAFARVGSRLLIAARRIDRLRAMEVELRSLGSADVHVLGLDTRQWDQVDAAVSKLPEPWRAVEILVNNAGLSRGLDKLHEGSVDDWNEMIDTNVKGLLHIDRATVPLMVARGRGTVVHIGSIAGHQVYPAGNVYCATKYAVRALTDGLRLDLLGSGVRVVSVDPGMVVTEFSQVRFHGDEARAAAVYRGMRPLSADDVADAIVWAASRPAHVCAAEILLLPTDQVSAMHIHRSG